MQHWSTVGNNRADMWHHILLHLLHFLFVNKIYCIVIQLSQQMNHFITSVHFKNNLNKEKVLSLVYSCVCVCVCVCVQIWIVAVQFQECFLQHYLIFCNPEYVRRFVELTCTGTPMSGQRKSSRGSLGEFHMTTTLFRYGSPYSLLKELISTCKFYKYLLVFQSTATNFVRLTVLVLWKDHRCLKIKC
jgi:hypothetical protein